MKRVFLIVALLVIAQVCYAGSRNKAEPPKPLYVGDEGWQIKKAVPGKEVTGDYEVALDEIGDLPSWVAPPYMRYIVEHGSSLFYGFVLRVPEDLVVYWSPKSELTITYVCGKDTLTTTSSMIFFISSDLSKMYFVHESSGEFAVPSPAVDLCSNGDLYALFAMFPFRRTPDYLISCIPRGVRVARR